MSVFSLQNAVLKSMFNSRSKLLNVISYNVQSLIKNLDEIRLTVDGAPIDILCFSETFLTSSIPNSAISISGFNIFRKDRGNSLATCGGVCMFINEHIKCKVVNIPTVISQVLVSDLEFIFIEIYISKRKLLFGTIYNPPKTNKRSYAQFKKSLVDLEHLFKFLTCKYDEIYISGDFNFDILQSTLFSRNYMNILNCLNLSVYNFRAPTYFIPTSIGVSCSLLDHIVCCSNNSINFFQQLSLGLGSHHDLLAFSVNCFVPPKPKCFSFRDFSKVNDSTLSSVCCSIDWEQIFSLGSSTGQIELFNHFVNSVYDRCVPVRTVTLKVKSPPWMTSDISVAIRFRISKYRLWKRCGSPQSFLEFQQARNRVVGLIRLAKRNYFREKLDPSLPSKVFWSNVRNLGLGKCRNVCKGDFNPDDINNHFINSNLNCPSPVVDTLSNETNNSFWFSNISINELYTAIWKVKSESTGLDRVSLKLVKKIFPFVSKYLLHIFNFILTSSSYPNQWKLSKVVPIPKVSHPSEVSHFRPISILSSLSKAFEVVVKNQIMSHLNSNNLINIYQSGFRKSHSTSTALLTICDDIRKNMDNKNLTSLTLLDFSKAFDCINHKILFNKLVSQFKFSLSAAKLIFGYLTGRSQSVFFNSSFSKFLPLSSGVPQGSVLGPLLFSMYINDIASSIQNCSFHIFADDVQIYRSCPLENSSIVSCISLINDDLTRLFNWSVSNGLMLNSTKTQSIIIYKKILDTCSFPGIYLNDSLIPFSNTVRDLGLVFNKTLTWGDHLVMISKRVFGMLSCLYKVIGFTDFQFKKRMILSYLLPHFIYGDIVLFGMLQENMHILQRCFNACTRFIVGIRKYDHISPYSDVILGCSLPKFYEFRVCRFIYHLLQTKQPSYLYSKLLFSSRYSSNFRLLLPQNSCRSLNTSFFVRGISLWNSLPLYVKSSSSVFSFKSKYFAGLA